MSLILNSTTNSIKHISTIPTHFFKYVYSFYLVFIYESFISYYITIRAS